jgi:hypothetical protein
MQCRAGMIGSISQPAPAGILGIGVAQQIERGPRVVVEGGTVGCGDHREFGGHVRRTLETHALQPAAKRPQRRTGLVGAVKDEAYGQQRVAFRHNFGQCGEPADPGRAAGPGGAPQRQGRAQCRRRRSSRQRMIQAMNDDGTRQRLCRQISLPIARAVSDMRLEKPHSLSYQLRMRQNRLSITTVCFRSKVEECGS